MSQRDLFAPEASNLSSGAAFECDGKLRLHLWRTWDAKKPPLVFCMLNPSTADGVNDDQTIRQCCVFAKRERAGGIEVVNLVPWRATDPKDLIKAIAAGSDVYGAQLHRAGKESMADEAIRVVCTGKRVVVAWGAITPALKGRAKFVLELLEKIARNVLCLGKTADGHPKHPCRLGHSTPLWVYTGES